MVGSVSIRCIERALPIRSSFSGMAIGMSMTAVLFKVMKKSLMKKSWGDREFAAGSW
jgi:hypothetical protein